MTVPARPIVAIAAIALLQGVALVAYTAYDIVEALRVGASGPAEVSSVPAIVLLIVIQLGFGLGLLWVARGFWLLRPWARAPFVVAQLLGILLGYELAQSAGGAERTLGIVLAVVAVLGLVLAFTPVLSRSLEP